MTKKDKNKPQGGDHSGDAAPIGSASKVLTLDVDLYQEYLDDSNLTEDQRREFLETLWAVVIGFVELGYGVHPLQQRHINCGQFPKLAPTAPFRAASRVKSKDAKEDARGDIL